MKYLRNCEITQLNIADDFYEAYKRCLRPNEDNNIVLIPAFVNGFFAVEIYLKVLIGDATIKGHDIKNLVYSLPESIRSVLEESYKKLNIYELDFNGILEKIKYGFEFWRYIYEDDNKEFENSTPALYSERFLDVYLPLLKELAYSK